MNLILLVGIVDELGSGWCVRRVVRGKGEDEITQGECEGTGT